MAEYRLRVGESAVVRPRWWGKSWAVIYAGTLGSGVRSLVVQWTMGHNSAAYNLFLAPDQREFLTPVGRGSVEWSSPDEIRLQFG